MKHGMSARLSVALCVVSGDELSPVSACGLLVVWRRVDIPRIPPGVVGHIKSSRRKSANYFASSREPSNGAEERMAETRFVAT